ncbi:MAG: hypothetical protein QF535_03710 [Anaerolineales bacterium]|jgi:hypothetical protein|nr:hypothetical protein [Anaerolineales bacterium]|tara:strand:+ start:471 stop:692 length:222 start_codon:yes stop_codon:yes gene_type:complete
MNEPKENGSWAEWRRLVLSELNRLDGDITQLQNNQKEIEVQIASQTTKLAMIGTIGGAIVGAICAIIAKAIAS